MTWIFASAVLVGLLSSAHCLGMCGGIAAAYTPQVQRCDTRRSAQYALIYNSGRVISYTIAGAAAGALGWILGNTLDIAQWSLILRSIAGVLIALVGIQLAFRFSYLQWFDVFGKPLWRLLAPWTKRLMPARKPWQWLLLGMLWGWLPCGMVYSMLLVAMTAGSGGNGALVMLSFAIGTLPSMLLAGVTLARFGVVGKRYGLRRIAGVMCLLFGVWTVAAPLMPMPSSPHHPLSTLNGPFCGGKTVSLQTQLNR